MLSDFKDLLRVFSDHRVEYLVVGAHALAVYGYARATRDLDIWVNPDPVNAKRVFGALVEFGAPLHDLTVADLSTPEVVFQIGVEPSRIDLLTAIDGLEFDGAWGNRYTGVFDGLSAAVIGRDDLIINKRASGRPQDLVDIQRLNSATDDSPDK